MVFVYFKLCSESKGNNVIKLFKTIEGAFNYFVEDHQLTIDDNMIVFTDYEKSEIFGDNADDIVSEKLSTEDVLDLLTSMSYSTQIFEETVYN
jgi:hypothetical protein